MKSHFLTSFLALLLVANHAVGGGDAVAGHSRVAADDSAATVASVVEVRNLDEAIGLIRQHQNWQILQAAPFIVKKESGICYRFKLINSTGQVRIIYMDPKNPLASLLYLEQ